MNNHKSDIQEGGHKGMMWMMVICCLVPVIFLLGGGVLLKFISLRYVLLALIGVFVIFRFRHILNLSSQNKSINQEKDVEDPANKKSCCH